MGQQDGSAQPGGVLLNGLLPNGAGSVTRALEMDRWLKAEERTTELIDCIQPNSATEERRHGVANFVRCLIMKCFPCQVFMFGSVPLKTYLPDGDIDLTVMSENEKLKDTWASKVRDALENEERSDTAEFHVKEVQYIQAEVKIIKCIVENIVVDISFYQVGGLCTLCFLEEIDHLINQNHLFKRSVILTKAWCYYESRILGAHHGLISTYALETLVLYIFHVFNNSFAGPLEVLYRFLEFFSNFDWDNFCVSLWGPVPINSLPDTTAEQPRKDGGELLLSKLFLNACSTVYAVFPGGHERPGKPFIPKHFNVIDPLQTSNNLGRSVSKGNFFRIRSAFKLGAKRLAVLIDCSKENVNDEVNQFFMNTWKRHESGHRPDAHIPHLWHPQPLETVPVEESNNSKTTSSIKKKIENGGLQSNRDHQADGRHAVKASSQLHNTLNQPLQNVYMTSNSYMPYNSHSRGLGIQNNSRDYYPLERNSSSNRNILADSSQYSLPYDHSVNSHGLAKFQFARTQSSPELTQTSGGVLSRGARNSVVETWIKQNATPRPDYGNRRNNLDSKVSSAHMARPSIEDPSSLNHSLSYHSLEAGADSDSVSNSYHEDTSLAATDEELASVSETMEMRQEEQDLVNMMSSSMIHTFGGPVQLPMHLAPHHVPFRYSPILPSPSYAQRNLTGIVPTISSVEPYWGSNIQFMQGFQSSPSPHFFPNVGLNSNAFDMAESGIEDPAMTEVNPEEIWQHEQYSGSGREFDSIDGGFQMLHSDDEQHSYAGVDNYFPSTWGNEAGVSVIQSHYKSTRDWGSLIGASVIQGQQKSTRPCRNIMQECHPNSRQVYQNGWQFDGSSDDVSGQEHDTRDWVRLSTISMDTTQKIIGSASSSHFRSHQLLGHEPVQIGGPDSMVPTAPFLDGNPCPRVVDNSGVVPLTFYPTGPPVPFLTMFPMYNSPSDTGNSEGSRSEIDRDEREDFSHTTTSSHNLDSTECLDPSVAHMRSSASVNAVSEPSDEHKSDILHSDFACHWQNLQYGRFCQNTRNHGPLLYSSVMVPPIYSQGHFSQDGLGRPLSSNLVTQTMGYGPRLAPFMPLGACPNRHSGVFQHFGDEMPKYRGGTGTYLPNLKARDKQLPSTRNHRGSYSYNRSEPSERGGSWVSSKARAAGRNHEQKQGDKQSLRPDSITATKNRAGRLGDSYQREPSIMREVHCNSVGSSNSPQSSANTAYNIYVPAASSSSVDSSGHTNDQMAAYASTAKPLEFASVGQVHLPGANGLLRPSSANLVRGVYQQRHGTYREGSSRIPSQPSAPQVQS